MIIDGSKLTGNMVVVVVMVGVADGPFHTVCGEASVFGQLLVPVLQAPRQTPGLNEKSDGGRERWTERGSGG